MASQKWKWYSLPAQRILDTAPWLKFLSYHFSTHFRPPPPAKIVFLLFPGHWPPLFSEASLFAHWPQFVSQAFVYRDPRLCAQHHHTGVTSPLHHRLHFLLRHHCFAIHYHCRAHPWPLSPLSQVCPTQPLIWRCPLPTSPTLAPPSLGVCCHRLCCWCTSHSKYHCFFPRWTKRP